jgi:hypothetical protein
VQILLNCKNIAQIEPLKVNEAGYAKSLYGVLFVGYELVTKSRKKPDADN